MINRDDMLELSRRMTPARSSVSRIAGAYYDEDGNVDGTFNTHFLKLPSDERSRNLNLAKTILLAQTNEKLREYTVDPKTREPGGIWMLLDGILESSFKNDALLDIFYEQISRFLPAGRPSACFLYFGQYDVPVKGSDSRWMEGSEEIYTYLMCTISPLKAQYEPGKPEFGFLYPAFKGRSGNSSFINLFESAPGSYENLISWMTGA